MKKQYLLTLIFCFLFLAACGKTTNRFTEENSMGTVSSESVEDSNNFGSYEVWKFQGKVSLEDTIQNSNYLSFGYLAAAENGEIYYYDAEIGGIVRADKYGENKEKIVETGPVNYIQYRDGKLYWKDRETYEIYCLDIDSQKKEVIMEVCGEFILNGKGMYVTLEQGICFFDLESRELSEPLYEGNVTSLTTYADGVLGNLFDYDSTKKFMEGMVVSISRSETNEIMKNAVAPLMTNLGIIGFNGTTSSLHFTSFSTGSDTDYGIYSFRNVVSDGVNFYCAEAAYTSEGIACHRVYQLSEDGKKNVLVDIEKKYPNSYLYISEGCLYLADAGEYPKEGSLWYCYDLNTNELTCFVGNSAEGTSSNADGEE